MKHFFICIIILPLDFRGAFGQQHSLFDLFDMAQHFAARLCLVVLFDRGDDSSMCRDR